MLLEKDIQIVATIANRSAHSANWNGPTTQGSGRDSSVIGRLLARHPCTGQLNVLDHCGYLIHDLDHNYLFNLNGRIDV